MIELLKILKSIQINKDKSIGVKTTPYGNYKPNK